MIAKAMVFAVEKLILALEKMIAPPPFLALVKTLAREKDC
jgi:hypothetical protein